ncbi:hypothetical protein JXA48_04975 [Candidatus Woesearchaeota archaeon]|nr:hypothetical protein [Candidatus Woesearchaeota archaeon]
MAKRHTKHEKKQKTNNSTEESKTGKVNFFKNKQNEKWLIVVLILVAIGLSTFFRMYPSDLPATDKWAEDSIKNQISSQVSSQVSSQYPNLPTAQKQQLINEEVDKVITAQKEDYNKQVEQTSKYFKSQLQDENDNTYLLAIDPYLWYSQAKNIEANGFQGDEIVDGKQSFSLRNGREARPTGFSIHPALGVLVHKIGSIFNKDFTLQRAMFILPVILISLAIIFAFFLARKIGGNVAGFVAGLAIALNTALLGRTPAGFSDTDSYIIMFPLLIAWTALEAMTAKDIKQKMIWTSISAIGIVLFRYSWSYWWYIGSLLLGVLGVHFIYSLIINKEWNKYNSKNFKEITKTSGGQAIIVGISFLLISGLILAIVGLTSVSNNSFVQNIFEPTKQMLAGPIMALHIKNVATGSNIWPNVLTTVAELNAGSWAQVIASVGGKVLFTIGLLGVLLTFFIKTESGKPEIRYAALLTFWFIGIAIMGVIASRFIALLAAPFAIAFGVFFGILWTKGSVWIKKSMQIPKIATQITLIVLILILFIAPIKSANAVAIGEVPSMNDAWYNSLTTIKNDTNDGIITSWWDFGHWFVNVAETRVTFDGGDQGKRIYWVGKSLMTENLTENKAILRMLNCGQNKGYERIFEYTNNSYLASKKINEIIYQTKDEAKANLLGIGLSESEANSVLEKTHCDDSELLDQYYITSQDMVGKAGVWAHFGSWDFDKAFVYNTFKNKPYDKALQILLEQSPYDEDTLNNMYYEINTLADSRSVDSWISPWPNYVTANAKSCKETATEYTCSINQVIGQQQGGQVVMETATIPKNNPLNTKISIGLYNGNQKVGSGDSLVPKEVSIITEEETKTYQIPSSTLDYELAVANTPKGVKAIISDTVMGTGAFTRLFFFEGVGMKGYEVLSDITDFTGQRIIVYKVNLSSEQ